MRRARLKPISEKRRAKTANEKALRDGYLRDHPYCEAALAGAPGACYGRLSVHEVVPRGRGGDTGDIRLFKSCCLLHNDNISQDKETMRWATENGFLFHGYNDFLQSLQTR